LRAARRGLFGVALAIATIVGVVAPGTAGAVTLAEKQTILYKELGSQPYFVDMYNHRTVAPNNAFNWTTDRDSYITPDRPDRFWFEKYISSAQRFRDIVAKAGADVLIANHTNFDGTKTKIPALAQRAPGAGHPYVIGNESVRRYLTVAEECAKAGELRTPAKIS